MENKDVKPQELPVKERVDRESIDLKVDTNGQKLDLAGQVNKADLSQTEPGEDSIDLYDENGNWFELRMEGKPPERRGYHSTFIANNQLFIYGGHDIREGSMDTLWKLDLATLSDLEAPEDRQQRNCEWILQDTKGKEKPGALAHHTSVVHNDKMYLYGGSNLETENHQLWALDPRTFEWRIVPIQGAKPVTRDEHTAVMWGSKMVICGGFVLGQRVNDIWILDLDTFKWTQVNSTGTMPEPRAGHSCVIYQDALYVFGGKDEENNKLNDFWSFNLTTNVWTQIAVDEPPMPRSGHSAQVYGDKMIIFAGIYEITKELNDMCFFDFKQKKWMVLFEEAQSPKKSPERNQGSPSNGNTNNGSTSPTQVAGVPNTNSRNAYAPMRQGKSTSGKTQNQSFTLKPTKNSPSPQRKLRTQGNVPVRRIVLRNKKEEVKKDQAARGLVSPTSVSMKNSFIIKNADTSFDIYYTQMKKRKHQSYSVEATYGRIKRRRPAARDGHSAIIHGNFHIVFGGDRHHMPFNDIFYLDIATEMNKLRL